jgi:hypothetical protein
MLYLFHGNDAGKVREKAFQWVSASRAKQPEAPYIRIPAEALTPNSLHEALSSQGLFFKKTLILIDDPFSLKDSGELVMESLALLASSENPIGILAPNAPVARVKKLEAKAEKIFKVDLRAPKASRGFNSALVNALSSRNREALWLEIMKCNRLGDAPEATHGLLHWKARDMMEKGHVKWGKEGARALSRKLIELLSDARSGGLPLSVSLERFALSL